MCDGQRMAIDIIKSKGGSGISPEMILIHEEICKDFAKMKQEINEIKKDVSDVKGDIADMKTRHKLTDEKVDRILELLNDKKNEQGIYEKTLNSPNAKYVFYTLIVALLIIAALFGVPLTDFKGIVQTMGG